MPYIRALILLAAAILAGPATAAVARGGDDRLPDRWEKRHGLSTARASGDGDPDKDGLSNRREFALRLNPRNADTDGDGLRDGSELKRHRTNPRRADTDGDGAGDGAEIRAGTNPRKRGSRPPGTPGAGPGGGPVTNPPGGGSGPGAPAPAPPAKPGGFPSPGSTGVPAGWTPAQTRTTDLRITQAGAVVQDVLLQGADIVVDAPNVTIRRVKMQGGWITNNEGRPCHNGLVIEDTTIEPPPGQNFSADSEGVISYGGYTARRVKIWRRSEGFRVSGAPNCGAVRIQDSFAKIVIPNGRCDLHADGIQGYYGNSLAVENTTIDFTEARCGTAPFFVPKNQGNTDATVNGLLVMGGGYSFRMGVPGSVSGLKIVDGSWGYGPINVLCSAVRAWDASIVNIDANYQVTKTVRNQPCNTNGGE